MVSPDTQTDGATAVAPSTRQPDWPLIIFFALAYLIAWGMIPVLAYIAQQSGVADWPTLSEMGESATFGNIDFIVPHWPISLIMHISV